MIEPSFAGFWAAIVLIVHHHVLYPLSLRLKREPAVPARPPAADDALPSITLIVPAHNEERYIARKIDNLAHLRYPGDRLSAVVALDGCTDDTVPIARRALADAGPGTGISLEVYENNVGKLAVLNRQIAVSHSDIVGLTDTSADIPPDALERAAAYFADPKVGVVCPTYALPAAATDGEKAYWRYQIGIKRGEARFGCPMGAHGSLYFFRRSLWAPLPADTINDDFVLPMRIVAQGYVAVYDNDTVVLEREVVRSRQDFFRRVRIAAGNLQQTIRLWRLAFASPGVSYVFLSGKALRSLMPFILVWLNGCAAVLAWDGRPFYIAFLLTEGAALAVLALAPRFWKSRLLLSANYLAQGYVAGLIGAFLYSFGLRKKAWRISSSAKKTK